VASEPKGRFPVGLTIASAFAFAILIALGVWQVKRLAWKTDMLARIEALQHAPARPLDQVLAGGGDLEFSRVSATCPGLAHASFEQIYAVVEGEVAYRLVSACRLASEPYDGVLVDRGFVAAANPQRPSIEADDRPITVTGVLRKGDRKPAKRGAPMAQATEGTAAAPASVWYGRDLAALAQALKVKKPAPYFLMAETPTNPELPALKPAPIPTDIPNNHLSYAITWFGLAAALAGVYAALLRRKMQGR
jgi:surfeit locus 1 family protein